MAKNIYQAITGINALVFYPHPIVGVRFLTQQNFQQDEKPAASSADSILNEDGSYILNEDGGKINIE